MIAALLNIFVTALVTLACTGLGYRVLRWTGFSFGSRSEAVVLSAGTGLTILIYSLVALGGLGFLYSTVALGMLALFALLGLPALQSIQPQEGKTLLSELRSLSWLDRLLLALYSVYGFAYLLTALTPTLEGDSLYGYLVLPREYAHHHALVPVDYAYGTIYPQNGQLISTLGFLLQGQILAQLLVVWLMGLLASAVIFAFGRTWLSQRAAWVAAVIWCGMFSVGYVAASAKIDLAWAFFDLLSIFAFSRWYFVNEGARHWRWLVLAGLFAGVAGGTKQATFFTVVVLSLGILVRLIQARERRLAAWLIPFAAFGLPASLAALWVVRTYLMTGNFAFTGQKLLGDSGVLGFVRTLWNMSMLGNAVSVEGPLGKPVGPTLLATLPLLMLLRRVDRRIWHMLAFSGLMIVLWFNGVQRARHLLPTLALLALVAGYVIVRLLAERRRLAQVAIATMVLALTTNLGLWSYINLVSVQRIPYLLGLHDRDRYLEVNLAETKWYPNYRVLRYVWDHVPQDARIAALSTGNSFYVERPFYAGWGQWNHSPANDPNAQALLQMLESRGITHVFVNNYVVERRNYEDAWLLQSAFQDRYLTRLICADGQCLYAISDAPAGIAGK